MLHICFFNVRICKNGLASYQWLCWVVEVVGTRPWQDCWGSQPPILIGSHFKSFIHVHWAASPDATIEVWRHFKLRQYNVNMYLPAVVSDFSSLTFLYKKTWIGAVLVKVMPTTKCVMSRLCCYATLVFTTQNMDNKVWNCTTSKSTTFIYLKQTYIWSW